MKNIKYEIDGGHCLTYCEYRSDIKVGSMTCDSCQYKVVKDTSLQIVTCKANEIEKECVNEKTSAEWQSVHSNTLIIDPDGWDRKNFVYSWFEELVTEEEYRNRQLFSTIRIKK